MGNKEHSDFAPSGMTRRESCPGSYVLERDKGVETHSSFAREGSAGHDMIDKYFQRGIPVDQWTEIKDVTITDELRAAVRRCILYVEALEFDDSYHEMKVALNNDVWGTADLIGVREDGIWVIDYKFGQGVKVKAENNLQLAIYGVGAVQLLRVLGHENLGDKTIHLVILQPRIEGNWISEVSMTVEQLILSTVGRVADIVQRCKSEEGQQTFVSGSQCQFCSAKAFCPLHAEKALSLARSEFKLDLDLNALLEIHEAGKDISAYLKAVEQRLILAVETAELKDAPYKVEQRYGNEKWKDDAKALSALVKVAKGVPIYAPSKMLTPAKIKALFEKNKIDFDLKDLVEREPTSKALVKITNEQGELE